MLAIREREREKNEDESARQVKEVCEKEAVNGHEDDRWGWGWVKVVVVCCFGWNSSAGATTLDWIDAMR